MKPTIMIHKGVFGLIRGVHYQVFGGAVVSVSEDNKSDRFEKLG